MHFFSFLFLSFYLLANSCFSQFDRNYKPVEFTDTIPEFLNKAIKEKIDQYKTTAQASTELKEIGNYKCKMYDGINKAIVSDINDGYFIIDHIISPYLQKILDNIYANNPQLKKDARVYA